MKNKIGIVANDAGGANIILAWIKSKRLKFNTYLLGPAEKIFSGYNNKSYKKNSLSELIKDSDLIITGSGWQSNLEYNAIKKAKLERKKVITFLDGWTNYKERFIRKSTIILPDEVWVQDKYAYKIAKEKLKKINKIKIVNNPYFKEIILKLKKSKKKKNSLLNILYVTEPINKKGKNNYKEFLPVRFFLKNIEKITNKRINKISIRTHPAEKKDKYNFLIKEFKNLPIKINMNKELYKDILENNWVVGCNTTPMIVGLLSKKKVYSSIPPNFSETKFPLKGIIKIKNIIKKYK